MTRFGVMRHLDVLEAVRLITTRRDGRRKLHYQNAVPIRLLHDRWISRYAEPFVGTMAALKLRLEGPAMANAIHVHEVHIRTTPERLWQALTEPEQTRQYWYGTLIRSAWTPGARWTSESPEGVLYLEGEVVECDPPRRLVQTFRVVGDEEATTEPSSRVTWQIEEHGEVCKLTLVHEEMDRATEEYVTGGWEYILSGLKTLLETGRPLEPAAGAIGA